MKRFVKNKITAWMMLIYFIGFVIPPVSTFADTGLLNVATDDYITKKPHREQTRLFVIDLLLWQQITQTKRGDSLINISGFGYYDDKETHCLLTKVADFAEAVHVETSRFSRLEPQQVTLGRSRLAHIRYARSGISPPYLS